MNSSLRIQVRILAAQAVQQVNAITSALKKMASAAGTAGAAGKGITGGNIVAAQNAATTATQRFGAALQGSLSMALRFGKSIQSAGRQLTYNFTYPLVQAGKAIFGLAMDNQKAITRLQKVYGDASTGVQAFAADQEKLLIVFRKLSDRYGIAQSDVINLSAAWAAAGATGFGLAKAVQTTIEALTLGDFTSTEEAVNSLISVQTAYKLNANQLEEAIFNLNAVENQTAIQFTDLVRGFVRVGSTASTAGVGVNELAAMLAALVPTTGSAETAGNGLKTILTRIMAPTAAVSKALQELGINFKTAFAGKTATERLKVTAEAFKNLDSGTKTFIATQIAGRFQVNRFIELMNQIVNPVSQYNTALAATSDKANVLAVAQREINTILESSPQKFQILQTRIQNMLVSVLTPLIPVLLQITAAVERMVHWFSELPASTRQWILIGLAVLAIIGPIVRITGAFIELGAIMGQVGVLGFKAIILLSSPFGLLTLAILGAIVVIFIFRKQVIAALSGLWEWMTSAVGTAVRGIIIGFWGLVHGIGAALSALIHVVASYVSQFIKLISYLNPFARHSPSLVDQVDAGIAHIIASYARLSNIGAVFKQAAKDFAAFKAATAGSMNAAVNTKRQEQKVEIQTFSPGSSAQVDAIFQSIDALTALMAIITDEYAKQKTVVDDLSVSLDAAQRAYDAQNETLTRLKDRLSVIGDALNVAKTELDGFVNAPLAGLKAMDEEIFQNEIAQKRLRLEMLKLKQAGQTFDDLTAKIAALQGTIEATAGKEQELRQAGAGSDILSFYDDQLKALRNQQKAFQQNLKPVDDLQQALDDLQTRAEKLDLEKALKFDPLQHAIQLLADTTKELTFDQIVAGIKRMKPQVEDLTRQYDLQSNAVTTQQAVVDQYKAHLDDLQKTYDTEKAKLDDLGSAYDAAEANVRMLQSAYDDLASAAKTAADAAAAAANAGGAAAGDFQTPTLTGIGDTAGSIDDLISQLDKQIKDSMDKLDFVGPFKKKWEEFKTAVSGLWEGFGKFLEEHGVFGVMRAVEGFVTRVGEGITNAWDSFWGNKKEGIAVPMQTAFSGALIQVADQVSMIAKSQFKNSLNTNDFLVPVGFKTDVHGVAQEIRAAKGDFDNNLKTNEFLVPLGFGEAEGSAVIRANYIADLNTVRNNTDLAGTAADTYAQKARLMAQGATTDIDRINQAFDRLTGQVNLDQTWINLQNEFDQVKTKAELAGVTAQGTFDHASQAGRDYQTEINNVKQDIIDLGKTYDGIPVSKVTTMIADLDGGAYQKVKDQLDILFQNRSISLEIIAHSGAGYAGIVPGTKSAMGSPPGGLPEGWALMGEAGRELAYMPRGTKVFTNKETEKILKGTTAQSFASVSSKTVNINGDLSFPNITKPDDAEAFIRNLEALAAT